MISLLITLFFWNNREAKETETTTTHPATQLLPPKKPKVGTPLPLALFPVAPFPKDILKDFTVQSVRKASKDEGAKKKTIEEFVTAIEKEQEQKRKKGDT